MSETTIEAVGTKHGKPLLLPDTGAIAYLLIRGANNVTLDLTLDQARKLADDLSSIVSRRQSSNAADDRMFKSVDMFFSWRKDATFHIKPGIYTGMSKVVCTSPIGDSAYPEEMATELADRIVAALNARGGESEQQTTPPA